MGATNDFSKVSWKSVYTFQKTLENQSVVSFKRAVCRSDQTLGNKSNTTAREFREIYEIPNPFDRSNIIIYSSF
jgi:hypothetical protein